MGRSLCACRLMQNGYNISSLAPNKGVGALVKKIIMQSVDPLPGQHSTHVTPPVFLNKVFHVASLLC